MSGFKFGARSHANLSGVHPDLVTVVHRALGASGIDFAVTDGIRTVEEQRDLFRRGFTTTMNSQHIPQDDGFGHAVDLVPWVNGKPNWGWPGMYQIAECMRWAANELKHPIRWGGTWAKINGTTGTMEHLSQQYAAERAKARKRVFLDGPHYELTV